MDDKKQLLEKQLNYITSNFELDLLRLIKTRSYISMSKEVIDEELNSVKQLSVDFQERLKELVMRTLELEADFANDSSSNGIKTQENFKHLKDNINNYISSTEKYISNLESRHIISQEKLDSLQKYYLMELEASREELDFRIKSLQGNMSKMFDGDEIEIKNYHDQITKKHIEIEKEIETKVLDNQLKSGDDAEGEFDSVLKAAASSESSYGEIRDDISATTEIRKYRKNKREKWQRIFGIIFLSGIISICITLFYFYNKDYKNLRLAEESYKESKTLNKDPEIGNLPVVINNEVESSTEINEEVADKAVVADENEVNELSQVDNEKEIAETITPPQVENSEKTQVEPKVTETFKKFTLKGKGANVRSGPSTRYGVVTVVKRGEVFESLNENSRHWIKIKLANEKEGWISGRLIKEVPQ